MSALEIGSSGSVAGAAVFWTDGSRSRATLKHKSKARHMSGWLEFGWERMHACRRYPNVEARSVAATWSGGVWPWLRRTASAMEWFRTAAASGVRVRWILLDPALMALDSNREMKSRERNG
ncbi:hypothetical protein OROGR_013761 [Orobanche gracilis]